MMAKAAQVTAENERTAEVVRHDILRHAEDLFAHYGFHKTNVGDIAERVGMSPGNLYRYYRNKADIGCAVVGAYFRMSEAEMQTALMLPIGTAEDRIRALIRAGVSHIVKEMEQNPRLVELAEFICENEQGIVLLQAHIDWIRTNIAREIRRGIEAGEIAECDPEITARAIHNACKSLWVPMMLHNLRKDLVVVIKKTHY